MEIQLLNKNNRIINQFYNKNQGATIIMEIYRSGKTIDGRVVTPTEVRTIVKNTNDQILSKGITIPLKFGHFDDNQELKGEVVKLELRRKRRKNLRVIDLSIIAHVNFFDAALELWYSKKLKNVSVEIAENGYNEDGQEFGKYLSALALLGSDPPAIPWLQTEFNEADYLSIQSEFINAVESDGDGQIYYYQSLPKIKKNIKKSFSMDNEKFQSEELISLRDKLAEALDLLDAYLGTEEEPAPEDEMPPEEMASENNEKEDSETNDFDKDAKIADLEAKLKEYETSTQLETAFNKLVSAGHANQSHKSMFMSLASDAGLDVAVKHYSKQKINTPPLTPLKPEPMKNGKSEPWKQYVDEYKAKRKKEFPHEPEERVMKYATTAAQYRYKMETRGGVNYGTN